MLFDAGKHILCSHHSRIDQVFVYTCSDVPVEGRSCVQNGIDTLNGIIEATFFFQILNNDL